MLLEPLGPSARLLVFGTSRLEMGLGGCDRANSAASSSTSLAATRSMIPFFLAASACQRTQAQNQYKDSPSQGPANRELVLPKVQLAIGKRYVCVCVELGIVTARNGRGAGPPEKLKICLESRKGEPLKAKKQQKQRPTQMVLTIGSL